MENTAKNKLKHLIIRVPKSEASFTYFQFEANDNLCFYSTLESSLSEPFRDIEVRTHETMAEELMRVISFLQSKFSLEILTEEWIDD